MIGYLRGRVLAVTAPTVVVNILSAGEEGALGYVVHVRSAETVRVGSIVEYFIHTNVREDALDLYGFETVALKNLFLKLNSVKGIGPKSAMQLLTKIDPGQLVSCIASGDMSALSKTPGIGKKTAERLVVELKDAFDELAIELKVDLGRDKPVVLATEAFTEAREALLALGYKEIEISKTLQGILQSDQSMPTQHVIKHALKELSNHAR